MEKKRSVGVTVFGIFLVLIPLWFVLSIFLEFIIHSKSLKFFPYFVIAIYKSKALVLVLQLVFVICGIGILRLKEWARKATVYLSSFYVALGLVTIIYNAPIPLAMKLMIIISNGLLYWFFTRLKVKEQFK